MIEYLLEQIEFFGAADGSPAIVHSQLGINVLGVGSHGVQRHHAFTGNFRTVRSVLSSLSTSNSRSLSGSIKGRRLAKCLFSSPKVLPVGNVSVFKSKAESNLRIKFFN